MARDTCSRPRPGAWSSQAKFATLLDRLLRHPVTIGNPPQAFTYANALTSVPLGIVSQWQSGAALLQQLWAASAAGGTAPARRGATTASGTVYTGLEQAYAVLCADGADPHGTRPRRGC